MDPKSKSQTFQPLVGDEIHGLCRRCCGTRYSAWCREWRMLIDQMERENLLFGVWFECCIDCISQILSVKMPKEFSFFRCLGFRFPRSGKTALQPNIFVKLHCTITEPRNSLAQVDPFGYAWRSSWCFWRSECWSNSGRDAAIWNTIPNTSEGNFWNSFQNLDCVFTVDAFFSPEVYSVFPLKCASFGVCDFLI